ncbi:MAG: hypothetical protein ACRD50_13830 [Candidatus Acidiferrales bacterium]
MKRHPARVIAILLAAAAITAVTAIPRPSSANTLSSAVIGMFPKDTGEFAYADLKAARKHPWFAQLQEQILPSKLRLFEQFMRSAGVDPDTQVEELAWGVLPAGRQSPEEFVGVALGDFSPSASEAQFKQQKLPVLESRGYHLYAFGSGSGPGDIFFFFIDSNTAAFGQREALEKLLDVRFGLSDSLLRNDKMASLVNEANGAGLIWAVMDRNYSQIALQQLLPQAEQFPQAQAMISRIQATILSVDASTDVDAKFQAVCASPDDANLLAAALQAGVMYRRYQEQQDGNVDMAKALESALVTPRGERLIVDLPVSNEQLVNLIRARAFAVPM